MAQTPLERGIAAMEAERFQQAIAILTQALDGRQLKSVEEIGLAYWHRGRAKASLGDCAGAIPDWEEAMALDASPDVYSNLGYCHFRLKQYDEAIPYLGFDAKNFPNAATFTLLGKAQALTDDFDGAEASFRSALELTPDYADAKQGLAAVKKFRAGAAGSAASSGARPTQTPAPPAAKPANATCKVARVQLGVDTVASVERDIQARGGSPLTGGGGPGQVQDEYDVWGLPGCRLRRRGGQLRLRCRRTGRPPDCSDDREPCLYRPRLRNTAGLAQGGRSRDRRSAAAEVRDRTRRFGPGLPAAHCCRMRARGTSTRCISCRTDGGCP